MKKSFLLIFIVSFYSSYSQVGIRTNDPKATLDIQAVDPAHPTVNDGIIIPRVNGLMNPALMSADQNGMLVFLTPHNKFYYWNNNKSSWISIVDVDNAVKEIDDLSDGKTDTNASSVYLGKYAGTNDNDSDNKNVGVGYEVLNNSTSSSINVGVGYKALKNNTIGSSNVAIGNLSLHHNLTGCQNVASGSLSMYKNTTGCNNVSFGNQALHSNKANIGSTAIGYRSMSYANDATNGIVTFNTAVGYESLCGSNTPSNNTGEKNTAIGSRSLHLNQSGSYNTAVGAFSLYFNSTGSFNTSVGESSLESNTTGYANTATGRYSLYNNTTGHGNTALGVDALYSNSTGSGNTSIGNNTLHSNTTGGQNTAVGGAALQNNTTGHDNTAIGDDALRDNTGGQKNTSLGRWSLYLSTTGDRNTAAGYNSMRNNDTGSENTVMGESSFNKNIEGSKNVCIGTQSGYNSLGDKSIFIGYTAGYNETTSNKLYVENSNADADSALIYGEFGLDASVVGNMLRTNAEFQIGSPDLNGYIFPIARGTNEQLLQTDGSGQLSWVASSSLGTDAQTLSYSGTILSISNGNTVTIPNGDITEVIAGDGLTGGGVSDDITINVEAINGITSTPDEIKLGGTLTENTSINQGDYHMLYNLNGNGDFSIEENGHSYFKINDNGDINADGSTFVLDASANKIGINKTTPNSFLDISANSSGGTGHIELTETGSGDGTRILFKNAVETDNKWTLYAKADNTNSDSYFNIHHTGTGNVLIVRGNGNVGIKRTPVTNDLEVNGTASKSSPGSWLGNSDRRLKTDIQTISEQEALQKLLKLRGVTYKWDDQKTGIDRPKGVQYGFIAQELMKVFPEKVTKDEEGYYQTAYADYDPLFVQAIKELNNQVELLKTLNKNIINENLELKKRLDKIESLINK